MSGLVFRYLSYARRHILGLVCNRRMLLGFPAYGRCEYRIEFRKQSCDNAPFLYEGRLLHGYSLTSNICVTPLDLNRRTIDSGEVRSYPTVATIMVAIVLWSKCVQSYG